MLQGCPPGGNVDAIARLLALEMGKDLALVEPQIGMWAKLGREANIQLE